MSLPLMKKKGIPKMWMDLGLKKVLFNVAYAEWTIPKGGMFVWVKITAVDGVFDLVWNECKAAGVLLLPGTAFNYDSDRVTQYIRLCYSYATADELDKVNLN